MISPAKADSPGATTQPFDSERFGPADSPLTDLRRSVAELQEYVSYYVAAQVDLAKARVRQIVVLAILGVVALVALAAMIVTASVQLLEGLAGAVAAGLDWPLWAGRLLAGPIFLILMVVMLWAVKAGLGSTVLRKTREHYAQRKRRQQAIFGRDVAQRAAAAGHNGSAH